MSRIGKQPVTLPQGVTVNEAGGVLKIKGPKGTLESPVPNGISCKVGSGAVQFTRASESREQRALHGLARALLANAVTGVSAGWTRDLEIQGIGYRAVLQGKNIEFALGYAHSITFPIPDGVEVKIDRQTRLSISGVDRQKVGQVAADIRALRPPEPYKGKGIRYSDEIIKKKVGKTGA